MSDSEHESAASVSDSDCEIDFCADAFTVADDAADIGGEGIGARVEEMTDDQLVAAAGFQPGNGPDGLNGQGDDDGNMHPAGEGDEEVERAVSQRMLKGKEKKKRRPDATYAFKLYCLNELAKGLKAGQSVASIAKRLNVEERRLRPSGWPKNEAQIRAAVAEIVKNNSTNNGMKRRRLPGGGTKCQWPRFEASLKAWLTEEKKTKSVSAGAFWAKVYELKLSMPEMKDARLGYEWRQGVKKRLGLRFRRPSRTAVLGLDTVMAKVSRMVTWHRVACNFYKPTVIITFDEAPMAFNAGFVRQMVLFDGEVPVNWVPPEEAKRMFTIVSAVAYDLESKKALFLKPMCIMKGKHGPPEAERRQYNKTVSVHFQEKAVVDAKLMINDVVPLLRKQTTHHRRCFVLDSARQHVTAQVLETLNKNGDFHTRVEEGTTCWCQLADLYIFYLLKHHYRNEFVKLDAQRQKPKFTASEKRIAVTEMVAKAWVECQKTLEGKMNAAFTELGLIPGTDPKDIIPFPLRPHGYKYCPGYGTANVWGTERGRLAVPCV